MHTRALLPLLFLIACGDDSSLGDAGPPPLDGSSDVSDSGDTADGATLDTSDGGPVTPDSGLDASEDGGELDAGPPMCEDDVCFEWLGPDETVTFDVCNPYRTPGGVMDRCPSGLTCEANAGARFCTSGDDDAHVVDLPGQVPLPDDVFITLMIDGGGFDVAESLYDLEFRGINGSFDRGLEDEVGVFAPVGEYLVEFGPLRGRLTIVREGSTTIRIPLAEVTLDVQRSSPDQRVNVYVGSDMDNTGASSLVLLDAVPFVVPAPVRLGGIATPAFGRPPPLTDFVDVEVGEQATLPIRVLLEDERFVLSGTVEAPEAPDLSQGTIRLREVGRTRRIDASIRADGSYSIELEAGLYDVAIGFGDDLGLQVARNLRIVESVTRDFAVERYDVDVQVQDVAGSLYSGVEAWVVRSDSALIGRGPFSRNSRWGDTAWGSAAADPSFDLVMYGDGETVPFVETIINVHPADDPAPTIVRTVLPRTFELRINGAPPPRWALSPSQPSDVRGFLSSGIDLEGAAYRSSASIESTSDPVIVTMPVWADAPVLFYTVVNIATVPHDLPRIGGARIDLSSDVSLVDLTVQQVDFRFVDDAGAAITLPESASLRLTLGTVGQSPTSLPFRMPLWSGTYQVGWECVGCGGAILRGSTSLAL
ncbi:MAG: hypothetical protein AB8H86_23070 [Polyangiales bacterium]